MIRLLVTLLIATVAVTSADASKKATKSMPSKAEDAESTSFAPKKPRLSTDIRFGGSKVDGKYLSAGDSVAEVENEKELNALIGIRKNFRDRLGAERARLKAEGK